MSNIDRVLDGLELAHKTHLSSKVRGGDPGSNQAPFLCYVTSMKSEQPGWRSLTTSGMSR